MSQPSDKPESGLPPAPTSMPPATTDAEDTKNSHAAPPANTEPNSQGSFADTVIGAPDAVVSNDSPLLELNVLGEAGPSGQPETPPHPDPMQAAPVEDVDQPAAAPLPSIVDPATPVFYGDTVKISSRGEHPPGAAGAPDPSAAAGEPVSAEGNSLPPQSAAERAFDHVEPAFGGATEAPDTLFREPEFQAATSAEPHIIPAEPEHVPAWPGPSPSDFFGDAAESLRSAPPPAAAGAPTPDRTHLWLVFLGTYAATTTIALLYLYFRLRSASGSGQLENLPDVPPLKTGEVRIYRMNAELPQDHVLRLGDRVRFGDFLVEPLRVTRGRLQFSHFTGDSAKIRPDSGEVLQLWLRITNESSSQTATPLDSRLLFARKLTTQSDVVANNFVSTTAGGPPFVFLFDQSPTTEWNIEGLAVDRPLKPGESLETFLPSTEEGLAELHGQLTWRFHLRKGRSPSGAGVTTLVEVEFADRDIQPNGRKSES